MRELIGEVFVRWTVIKFDHKGERASFWLCRCQCGKERVVNQNNLLSGVSKSCGCLQKEKLTTHGYARHPCYHTWHRMMQRCYDPTRKDYPDYGGRGIKVCDRWHNVSNFMSDMVSGWSHGLTIERIDNNRNYEPENCKWIPHVEQAWNTRKTILVDSPWGRLPARQVAQKAEINPVVFWRRLKKGEIGDRLYSRQRLKRKF